MLKDYAKPSCQVGMERTWKPCHCCHIHGLEGGLIEESSHFSEIAIMMPGLSGFDNGM